MHQFRDKSLAQRELVSAGLLVYPVLQAADVLAYRAARGAGRRGPARAPGADARRRARASTRGSAVARRTCWWCPSTASPRSARGSWTCRTRRARCPPPAAREAGHRVCAGRARVDRAEDQVAPSPTPAAEIRRAADKPGVSNLIEILAVARAVTPEAVEADLADARGYGDLKVAVARGRGRVPDAGPRALRQLRADEPALEAVLAEGAARARAIAVAHARGRARAMGVGAPPVGT